MTLGVRLDVDPNNANLGSVRQFVRKAVALVDWMDTDRLDSLELVVSEVVTNAVRAERAVGSVDPIELECVAGDDSVTLTVRDAGGGFEPDGDPSLPEPTLARDGGFGVPLMVELADEAYFVRTDSGTEVRLVFRPVQPAS